MLPAAGLLQNEHVLEHDRTNSNINIINQYHLPSSLSVWKKNKNKSLNTSKIYQNPHR
jgi:hypothetical protein